MRSRWSAARTIAVAGLVAGTTDIAAAFTIYGARGAKPDRILQFIASGLLGARAFEGGWATIALGALLHLLIATTAAAVYYQLTQTRPAIRQRPVLAGLVYGPLVYAVMNHLVVPFSAVRPRVATLQGVLEGIAIHMACVGLPIALVVAFATRERRDVE
jgi:hypothetical protein